MKPHKVCKDILIFIKKTLYYFIDIKYSKNPSYKWAAVLLSSLEIHPAITTTLLNLMLPWSQTNMVISMFNYGADSRVVFQ